MKKVLMWGLLIGLPANTGYMLASSMSGESIELIRTVLYAVGVVPLALAYAAGLALLVSNGVTFLALFSSLGRMALSNYILQTVVASIIFYGVGFGLTGKIGLTGAWLIGISFIICQLWISKAYLRKFKQGPLEFLWRRAIPKG